MEYVKSKLLSQESNPRPCTPHLSMASDSYGFIFSGCSSALVKYLSSRTDVQVPRSLFWGREHPDLTLYFTSNQTPASHSLEYSTALPVPLHNYIVWVHDMMTFFFDFESFKRDSEKERKEGSNDLFSLHLSDLKTTICSALILLSQKRVCEMVTE